MHVGCHWYYFNISHGCRTILTDPPLFFFQGSLKVGSRTASMKYIQPEERERSVNVSTAGEVFVFSPLDFIGNYY